MDPPFNEHPAPSESLPLFMSSPSDEPTENPALSALQSLVLDGAPDDRFVPFRVPRKRGSTRIHEEEVAQNFKEQGNEIFRGKRYGRHSDLTRGSEGRC
jgi:hypothetical protein